jgi:hypothetical protein
MHVYKIVRYDKVTLYREKKRKKKLKMKEKPGEKPTPKPEPKEEPKEKAKPKGYEYSVYCEQTQKSGEKPKGFCVIKSDGEKEERIDFGSVIGARKGRKRKRKRRKRKGKKKKRKRRRKRRKRHRPFASHQQRKLFYARKGLHKYIPAKRRATKGKRIPKDVPPKQTPAQSRATRRKRLGDSITDSNYKIDQLIEDSLETGVLTGSIEECSKEEVFSEVLINSKIVFSHVPENRIGELFDKAWDEKEEDFQLIAANNLMSEDSDIENSDSESDSDSDSESEFISDYSGSESDLEQIGAVPKPRQIVSSVLRRLPYDYLTMPTYENFKSLLRDTMSTEYDSIYNSGVSEGNIERMWEEEKKRRLERVRGFIEKEKKIGAELKPREAVDYILGNLGHDYVTMETYEKFKAMLKEAKEYEYDQLYSLNVPEEEIKKMWKLEKQKRLERLRKWLDEPLKEKKIGTVLTPKGEAAQILSELPYDYITLDTYEDFKSFLKDAMEEEYEDLYDSSVPDDEIREMWKKEKQSRLEFRPKGVSANPRGRGRGRMRRGRAREPRGLPRRRPEKAYYRGRKYSPVKQERFIIKPRKGRWWRKRPRIPWKQGKIPAAYRVPMRGYMYKQRGIMYKPWRLWERRLRRRLPQRLLFSWIPFFQRLPSFYFHYPPPYFYEYPYWFRLRYPWRHYPYYYWVPFAERRWRNINRFRYALTPPPAGHPPHVPEYDLSYFSEKIGPNMNNDDDDKPEPEEEEELVIDPEMLDELGKVVPSTTREEIQERILKFDKEDEEKVVNFMFHMVKKHGKSESASEFLKKLDKNDRMLLYKQMFVKKLDSWIDVFLKYVWMKHEFERLSFDEEEEEGETESETESESESEDETEPIGPCPSYRRKKWRRKRGKKKRKRKRSKSMIGGECIDFEEECALMSDSLALYIKSMMDEEKSLIGPKGRGGGRRRRIMRLRPRRMPYRSYVYPRGIRRRRRPRRPYIWPVWTHALMPLWYRLMYPYHPSLFYDNIKVKIGNKLIGSSMASMKKGEKNEEVIQKIESIKTTIQEEKIGIKLSETKLQSEANRMWKDHDLMITTANLNKIMEQVSDGDISYLAKRLETIRRQPLLCWVLADVYEYIDKIEIPLNCDTHQLFVAPRLIKLSAYERRIVVNYVWYEYKLHTIETYCQKK